MTETPTSEDAEPPEWTENFLNQIHELWINPEIERRRLAGSIDESFKIVSVQVLFVDGKENIVRFNEEVKAVISAEFNRDVQPGDEIYAGDITQIKAVRLSLDEADAGHITIIHHGTGRFIAFDFTRNKLKALKHVDTANQFIGAAEVALNEKHLHPFADNLYSAVELMAKARLMLHDGTVLSSKKHKHIVSRFNVWGRLGNVEKPFVNLLNKLQEMRSPARYLEGDLAITHDEAATMLDTAKAMSAALTELIEIKLAAEPKDWKA